jgi:hypothetical protein
VTVLVTGGSVVVTNEVEVVVEAEILDDAA